MLSAKIRKSTVKKSVCFSLLEDKKGHPVSDRPLPSAKSAVKTPKREGPEPADLTGALMELEKARFNEAARRLEDIVGKAAQFKDHMREGVLEEMEALKGENRRFAEDVAERVTGAVQSGFLQ